MYHVSAQGLDERMINVHYYYYLWKLYNSEWVTVALHSMFSVSTEVVTTYVIYTVYTAVWLLTWLTSAT